MRLLTTDGYKLSMAEAGWPLRRETFYYAHRKGGPALVPFDLRTELEGLLPEPAPDDYAYLAAHDYEAGAAFRSAVARREGISIRALPKGAWFLPREPIFSITGPSALVSWLEPLVLQLHYRIQIASLAVQDPEALAAEVAVVTCDEQREIVGTVLDAVGVKAPPMRADPEGYFARVRATVAELTSIVSDPARIFEVGLRAATCVAQHRIALEACKAEGIRRTSHVGGAKELGMIPVGTMGHEHVQRFGTDAAAFRAMRDRRPGRSSYLLDTFDTLASGIPAAFGLMAEDDRRGDSIRYDSGDKESQYRFACAEAMRRGLRPVHILEDGFDAAQTRRFEVLRAEVGWRPEEQFYGYGGYIVAKTSGTTLVRDRVAAVYKLSKTATWPTMKFGDEAGAGKESVPGEPIVFRRTRGAGALGVIGQAGEIAPEGYVQLTEGRAATSARDALASPSPVGWTEASPETRALVASLREKRSAAMAPRGAGDGGR
jgi:nicotinate phosphoribosyltransferase